MTRRDFGKPYFVSSFEFRVSRSGGSRGRSILTNSDRNSKLETILLHRIHTTCKMGWIDHIGRVNFLGVERRFLA
jgi:hypothetical protein